MLDCCPWAKLPPAWNVAVRRRLVLATRCAAAAFVPNVPATSSSWVNACSPWSGRVSSCSWATSVKPCRAASWVTPCWTSSSAAGAPRLMPACWRACEATSAARAALTTASLVLFGSTKNAASVLSSSPYRLLSSLTMAGSAFFTEA